MVSKNYSNVTVKNVQDALGSVAKAQQAKRSPAASMESASRETVLSTAPSTPCPTEEHSRVSGVEPSILDSTISGSPGIHSVRKKSPHGSSFSLRMIFSSFESDAEKTLSEDVTQPSEEEDDETWKQVFYQTLFPFIVSGLCSIAAGKILNWATTLDLLKKYHIFIVLYPSLAGLKGNLDMTFASRLSTMAHKSKLDDWRGAAGRGRIFKGIALVQAQAIVGSWCAVGVVVVLSVLQLESLTCKGDYSWWLIPYAVSTSGLCTCIAGFIMSTSMVAIILCSRRHNVNPDNITTPIAASVGDLLAISFLLGFAHLLRQLNQPVIDCVVTALLLLALPLLFWTIRKDSDSAEAARSCWPGILGALLISSFAGIVLGNGVRTYPDCSHFMTIIAGIGGNRVAVQASRISSFLHVHRGKGRLPEGKTATSYFNPYRAFFSQDPDAKTARLFWFTSLGFQSLFLFIVYGINFFSSTQKIAINPAFAALYILATFVQVGVLLYVCQLVVHAMWKWRIDPDIHAIPLLTSFGDVLGSCLLLLVYYILDVAYKGNNDYVHTSPQATELCSPNQNASTS